jgi:hypothetical protein
MKKALLALVILVFAGSVVSANPQIQSKHKNMKHGAKSINCNYCHNDAKVPRAKGSYGTAKSTATVSAAAADAIPDGNFSVFNY